MEAVIEKECSALGGLFQTTISDMKVRDQRGGILGWRGEKKCKLPQLPALLCCFDSTCIKWVGGESPRHPPSMQMQPCLALKSAAEAAPCMAAPPLQAHLDLFASALSIGILFLPPFLL